MRRSLALCPLIVLFALPIVAIAGPCDAYFSFDGDLQDSGGNRYHGLMVGKGSTLATPQFVQGRVGQALQLDGTSAMRSFIDLNFDTCPQVTVTAWIQVLGTGVKGTQYIFSTGSGSGPGIRVSGTNLSLSGSANGIIQRNAIRANAGWMFVAGVYDYTKGTYTLYSRNVDRGIDKKMGDGLKPPEEAIWVGAFNDSMSNPAVGLLIDDLRIHGQALGAEELRAVKENTATTPGSQTPAATTAPATTSLPSCSAHSECSTGSYCAWDHTCHPESHAPMQELELMPGTAPVEGFILDEDARLEDDPIEGEGSNLDQILGGFRQHDYAIVQVNSQVAESHMKYGMDLPLAVRVQVNNAAEDDKVVFYLAIGQPGTDEAVVISDRYESTGPGAHVATLSVPLGPPFTVVGIDTFKADLFLLGEKEMPGLPGQTVTLKTPLEDVDMGNNRKHLSYVLHRPTGYVLTHEHPTNGMAFGGNYAFAGVAGNYRHGIMQRGYTGECSGCPTIGNCNHGEVKGNIMGPAGALGRDMKFHDPEMGPYHDSNSHLRYSTEWIEEAFSPSEPEFQGSNMRIMVAFAVENEAMCEQLYYANKGHGGPGDDGYACSKGDSFASLKRQLDNLKAWATENNHFMEIAYSASDARRIVNENKLAIVLGVEAEYAFGAENKTFDPVGRLNEYYDEGARTFYLAHKINSRLAGADIFAPADSLPGKAIRVTQAISGCFYYDDNIGHFPLQGRLGKDLCDNNCGANAFKRGLIGSTCKYKFSEIPELVMADYVLTRGGGKFNGFNLYPGTPGFEGEGGSKVVDGIERNNLGLSHDGERVVREAMLKGMIVNIDHVSSIARDKMYELATQVFDDYPLNALHNKPNSMLTDEKPFWQHEYDLFDNELNYVKNTGGFFGFRMGPTDSVEYPQAGVNADCPGTSTESAKMLAWLIEEKKLNVGYALDYGTVTQGVHSRTMADCGLDDLENDKIHEYKRGEAPPYLAEGLSHIGMMTQWHRELEMIGLKQKYVDALKNDGVEAFLRMWEKSEAAAGTGGQIPRFVITFPIPEGHR